MIRLTSTLGAIVLLAGQPALSKSVFAPIPKASIIATAGMSEWVPSGWVSLDLQSGRYTFKRAASRVEFHLGSTIKPVSGRLSAVPLNSLRRAYAAALAEGLVEPACRAGGQPPEIVVSNGGPRIMELTGASGTATASNNAGCWTEAAEKLHSDLSSVFAAEARKLSGPSR